MSQTRSTEIANTTGSAWVHAVYAGSTIALAMFVLAVPLMAHALHVVLGLSSLFILAGVSAIYSPATSLVAIQLSFIFQNLIVSLLAPYLQSPGDFDMIRAYNFFLLSVTWVFLAASFLSRPKSYPAALANYVKITTVSLLVIGIYFLIGLPTHGIGAIVNLRNVVTPLLFFQVCLMAFSVAPLRIGPAITGTAILVLLCGLLEFLHRDAWLFYTNGETYWGLANGYNWETLAYDKQAAQTRTVITSLSDTFRIDFFNSPLLAHLGSDMMRLFGPNMHAISFAYCLTFLSLFLLYRGRFVFGSILFILLFLCSVKGPLIIFTMVCVSWLIFWLFGTRLALWSQILMISVYAAAGIVIGQRIGDYHVLGLMAGIQEFVADPLGHGIGAGGNFSPLFASIQWEDAQSAGRTPFPVESSVGVLLYQMGVFALLVIATYTWIAWELLKLAGRTRNSLHAAASFAILGVLVTGLFQEEAYFAPLALAMFLGLAGMILGAAIRTGLIERGAGLTGPKLLYRFV